MGLQIISPFNIKIRSIQRQETSRPCRFSMASSSFTGLTGTSVRGMETNIELEYQMEIQQTSKNNLK